MSKHINTKEIKAARKQRWAELSKETYARKMENFATRELSKKVPFANFNVETRLKAMDTEAYKNASSEIKAIAEESLENRKKFENV